MSNAAPYPSKDWYPRWPIVVPLIFAAVFLTWGNSFGVPFLFDDFPSIVANETLHSLSPTVWANPPSTAGETVSGRPILNGSFAFNHAIGELAVWHYHVLNVLVHAGAAVLLWAVMRRLLNGVSGCLPLVIAVLWALHPLQTSAVTYIVQRAESLAGFFALLTLYCFLRGIESGGERQAGPRGIGWIVASVAACLLGVGTKETIFAVPIVVLLVDRAFYSGTLREALRKRGWIHLALFLTWIPLAILILSNRARGGSAGSDVIGHWPYLLTQADAIIVYLKLVVWPIGQVFDYGTEVIATLASVWWQAGAVLVLLALTAWGLIRNTRLGLAGAVFFLLLAPSSSLVPVATQTVAEHRMYLPSAIVLCVLASAIFRPFRRPQVPLIVLGCVGVALAFATWHRNQTYSSARSVWADTVAKRPDNARAHYNLGLARMAEGDPAGALESFRRALTLQPAHAFAHFELGKWASAQNQWDEAERHFAAAVAADPAFVGARLNHGRTLAVVGRLDEAEEEYRSCLRLEPEATDAATNLAGLLIQKGQTEEAAVLLDSIIDRAHLPQAFYFRAVVRAENRDWSRAHSDLQETLRLDPTFAPAYRVLGNVLLAKGAMQDAENAYREALRLDPRSTETWFALGNLLARNEKLQEAAFAFTSALEQDGNHVQARNNLANCQLMLGALDEAARNYEAVLRERPDDASVKENLALVRQVQREQRLRR